MPFPKGGKGVTQGGLQSELRRGIRHPILGSIRKRCLGGTGGPRYRRSIPLYVALADPPVEVEVMVYTPEEVDEWSQVPHPPGICNHRRTAGRTCLVAAMPLQFVATISEFLTVGFSCQHIPSR